MHRGTFQRRQGRTKSRRGELVEAAAVKQSHNVLNNADIDIRYSFQHVRNQHHDAVQNAMLWHKRKRVHSSKEKQRLTRGAQHRMPEEHSQSWNLTSDSESACTTTRDVLRASCNAQGIRVRFFSYGRR